MNWPFAAVVVVLLLGCMFAVTLLIVSMLIRSALSHGDLVPASAESARLVTAEQADELEYWPVLDAPSGGVR